MAQKVFTVVINGVSESLKSIESLASALERVDSAAKGVSDTNVKVAASSKQTTTAMSEEEKAQKKLADTIEKTRKVKEGELDAQKKATLELQEATRERTRALKVEQYHETSIRGMGVRLNEMREAYKLLSEEERAHADSIGEGAEAINELDQKYKAAKESLGQYQDSVGNYEKGNKGLTQSLEGLNTAGQGLTSTMLASTSALSLFGVSSDETSGFAQKLQKVLALLGLVQRAYTSAMKVSNIEKAKKIALDKADIVQAKAKTAAEAASTKGTVAATVAHKAFNAVAAANPYLLIAVALASVVGILAMFISKTNDSTKAQQEALEVEKQHGIQLDNEYEKMVRNDKEALANAERELEVAEAQGKPLSEIYALQDKIFTLKSQINAKGRGFYGDELRDIEKNREEVERFRESLAKLEILKAQGSKKTVWDVDLDGDVETYKIDDAIKIAQDKIDSHGKKVEIGIGLKDDQAALDAEAKKIAAQRLKDAKEAKKAETDTIRQTEDIKTSLIEGANEQRRAQINQSYDRQIADIKTRLAQETNLTTKQRKSLNEQIVLLDDKRKKDLEDIKKEEAAQLLDLTRKAEDQRIAWTINEFDRRRKETKAAYRREREDLERKLEDDKTLTEEAREQIREIIANSHTSEALDIEKIRADELNTQQQADARMLSQLELTLQEAQLKIGEVEVRSKKGLKLIDVKATRKNLEDTNAALQKFIEDTRKAQAQLKATHEATLANLKQGTPEYEEEVERYAQSWFAAESQIAQAQAGIKEGAETLSKITADSLQEFFEKLGTQLQGAADAVSAVADTFTMLFEVQLEALNEQLDAVTEKYDKTVELREDSQKQVLKLEEELQKASGGTAEAIKQQLADEMTNRNDLMREEKRLAREKEKLDEQIAKKEKQMKRAELIANIAMGTASAAQGVANALGTLMFPLNFIIAGIVGAMGLIQVGIMTRQLTKLADGGEIVGPSHASGGIPIAGTNYEVEGGEFVTNKDSYAANASLVKFINSTDRTLTLSDLVGIVPDNPLAAAMVSQSQDDRILDAIESIDFAPSVAVSEIESVQGRMVKVRELSGFSN